DISLILNRLSIEENKLKKELAQDLRNQLQVETQDLKDRFQIEGKDLKNQLKIESHDLCLRLQEQIDISKQGLEVEIDKFDRSFQETRELTRRLSEIRDNFNQMNCDSKDINQNISQIKDFFSRIERHLDLNK
ncbi:MAG: hypothetical protein M0R17_10795, partial [Candidatus Omnitrophica bacterium]|nr:hypothetical protein [Candidatus Omnitrophota bacterium]